ncbi:peptidase M48-like protein [Streptomyces sp. 2333.5]|uniref:M56 family metallopeptidase n=1 Tax=unclassified Streptomyces TaxID=2593676 RepID=UPI00089C0DA5|nr:MULTISPECIES: M56 family metallopeptidase [unclassified Streptomyces]PJJ04598.1 peptidase M48-like protein [Streptomyces sp. 2333.5]SEE55723.1 Peptidase family M48 [Streptomyces sp. 2314.4]SEE82556.1 Peptidase family M48 [Streptomyces sp. 2112.2]
MIVAVWIPLLMPLLAVPAARRLAESLPPRAAAWLLAGCAAALAGCTTAALGLLAAAGALRLPPVAALGHLSLPLLGDSGDGAVTVPVAVAAAVLLTACTLAVGHHARRHRAELRTARQATGAHPTSGDLCVLPDPAPEAYALPGRPGRVVVTAGMLRALPPAEREALFAHERAHLAGRHHLFLLTATLSAACHPLLRSLRAPLAYALERWADEAAASRVGDRRVTARAIGRAALAARPEAGMPHRPGSVLAATAGPVPRRVAALLDGERAAGHPPIRAGFPGRRLIAAALLACVAFSAGAALDAAADLHETVEVAQGEVAH